MTVPWIIGAAAAGILAGPGIRAIVFLRSTAAGQPSRRDCPACDHVLLAAGRPWRWALPVTGRCRACQRRIGPLPLAVELCCAAALGIVAFRATSIWELAAFGWFVLLAIPLACIDVAVYRLPDILTITAAIGSIALLTGAALTAGHPARLGRVLLGAAVLSGCFLALLLVAPNSMGLGDAKLGVSTGAVLAWVSWQTLLTGALGAFLLAGLYSGALIAMRRATAATPVPMGMFIVAGAVAAILLGPVRL